MHFQKYCNSKSSQELFTIVAYTVLLVEAQLMQNYWGADGYDDASLYTNSLWALQQKATAVYM